MAENAIQSVGLAEGESRASTMYQMVQNQLFKVASSLQSEQPEKVEKAEKSYKSEKAEEKQVHSLLPVTNGDTFLKFMVDKNTNDITIYVVDRTSKRVMRSIPPNEVNNLKAGDLLKLLV